MLRAYNAFLLSNCLRLNGGKIAPESRTASQPFTRQIFKSVRMFQHISPPKMFSINPKLRRLQNQQEEKWKTFVSSSYISVRLVEDDQIERIKRRVCCLVSSLHLWDKKKKKVPEIDWLRHIATQNFQLRLVLKFYFCLSHLEKITSFRRVQMLLDFFELNHILS